MQSNIIAISGKIGSGKDLVCKLFQRHYMIQRVEKGEISAQLVPSLEQCATSNPFFGEGLECFIVKRFAGKLKQFVADILSIPIHQLDNQDFKKSALGPEWSYFDSMLDWSREKNQYKKEMTVRDMLIRIGNGMRERVHPDIWVNALFSEYKIVPNSNNITRDMVYPKWIIPDMRHKNEKLRVENLGGVTIRVERPNIPTINHISETNLDSAFFPYTINNNGTLEQLENQVKIIVNELSSTGIK